MRKQCIVNKTESEIVCTCFPDSMSELSEWYSGVLSESITLYSNLISNMLGFLANDATIMVSYYELYDRPNSVSQKKGMKGVFSRYKKEYSSEHETYVEFNNSFSFISIATISNINLNTFFVPQIHNVICSVRNVNINSIMDLARQNKWDVFIENLKQYSDAYVTYCDVGCDGNSIKIYTPFPSTSLQKHICNIAHDLSFEIIN